MVKVLNGYLIEIVVFIVYLAYQVVNFLFQGLVLGNIGLGWYYDYYQGNFVLVFWMFFQKVGVSLYVLWDVFGVVEVVNRNDEFLFFGKLNDFLCCF